MEQNQSIKMERVHDLSQYHQMLMDKYQDMNPETPTLRQDVAMLTAFNGYYSLNTAPGAFFAIDTNVYVNRNFIEPLYIVRFILALDGKTPFSCEFTGTFINNRLIQKCDGFSVDLIFDRNNLENGTTASCSGEVVLKNHHPINVFGASYNNPIPNSLFQGTYYWLRPIYLSDGKKEEVITKVLEIAHNNQIYFDFGSGDGMLKPVDAYVYNMNMYYFSFDSSQDSFIMGTAAAAGLACNNMMVTNDKIISRSLQTIVNPDVEMFQIPNLESSDLAALSGYYQLTEISPLAFFSVQAQYTIINYVPIYTILISVSLDGLTSKGYYFDNKKMSFNQNTLVMTEQQISLKFERNYNPLNRSLVKITGTIGKHQDIEAYTLFNPVPLSAFGGVPLTNSNGDSLTIVDDLKVTYNQTEMTQFTYVPLMYILANPYDNTSTVMSFGTSGAKGTACIISDVKSNKTSLVYSIPNAEENKDKKMSTIENMFFP